MKALRGTPRAPLALVHFTANSPETRPIAPHWKLGAFRLIADARAADEHTGGDFYAFELRDETHLSVFIGDVCGHGSAGAELLPSFLPQFDDLAHSAPRPSRLLEELNRRLAAELPIDRFVTGAAFELDARAGSLAVASAGHVPAVLRGKHGRVKLIGWASGPPLGMMPEAGYRDERYAIENGDVVVFMTDGVLEALEHDLGGLSTLTHLVAEAPEGMGEVHRSVLKGVDALVRAADDMTLLSLQVRSSPDSRPTIY